MCAAKYAAGIERHGLSNTPLYEVWSQMLARCSNPAHPSYRWYGGKGVGVCRPWRTFTTFRAWALGHGYEPGLTIDREEPAGHYEPGNCRWITQAENTRRAQTIRWNVAAFGETKTIAEWRLDPRCPGLLGQTIRIRLERGWEPAAAITTPARPHHRKP